MLASLLTIPNEYIEMKEDAYDEVVYLKLVERDYKQLKARIESGKRDELVPLYHEMNDKNLLIEPHKNMSSPIKPNTLKQILIENIWYEYSKRLCSFMFGHYVIVCNSN